MEAWADSKGFWIGRALENRHEISTEKETFLLNTNLQLQEIENEMKKIEETIATDIEIIELRKYVERAANSQMKNGVITAIMDAHRAYLQFCYELLQQRITKKEYDNALIYILAVLGVKIDGWIGAD